MNIPIYDKSVSALRPFRGRLSENLPNAMLMAYPDAEDGSLHQFHACFTRQAAAITVSNSRFAPDRHRGGTVGRRHTPRLAAF